MLGGHAVLGLAHELSDEVLADIGDVVAFGRWELARSLRNLNEIEEKRGRRVTP